MRRLVSLAAFCAALVPALAFGQISVTVLGLRAATADEEVATRMTEALRQAAESATTSGMTHTGRENALSQLLIVFDCEEPTSACMREIGESLSSDRLIYGLVEPASGRSDADYTVTLNFFNVDRGEVERDLSEVIPRNTPASGMIEPASRFYRALTGMVVRGELALRCNVPGARVLVGNEAVGTTSEEPLVLRDLEPGNVEVAVHRDGYASYQGTVAIEAGELNELTVNLVEEGTGGTSSGGTEVGTGGGGSEGGGGGGVVEPPRGRRSLAWLGWTNLGLSVVFAGLGIWGSTAVNSAQGDIDTEREQWPEDANVCDEAANGTDMRDPGHTAAEIDDICTSAGTMQILQFVFYGLSAVTFGIGLWLVLREYLGDDDDSDSAVRLRVEPIALQGGGAVSASLSF